MHTGDTSPTSPYTSSNSAERREAKNRRSVRFAIIDVGAPVEDGSGGAGSSSPNTADLHSKLRQRTRFFELNGRVVNLAQHNKQSFLIAWYSAYTALLKVLTSICPAKSMTPRLYGEIISKPKLHYAFLAQTFLALLVNKSAITQLEKIDPQARKSEAEIAFLDKENSLCESKCIFDSAEEPSVIGATDAELAKILLLLIASTERILSHRRRGSRKHCGWAKTYVEYQAPLAAALFSLGRCFYRDFSRATERSLEKHPIFYPEKSYLIEKPSSSETALYVTYAKFEAMMSEDTEKFKQFALCFSAKTIACPPTVLEQLAGSSYLSPSGK